MLPAHHTKHLRNLPYNFRPTNTNYQLHQTDDGKENGTALWLGAQCLSLYLPTLSPPKSHHPKPRAIELGSGVGLTACACLLLSLSFYFSIYESNHSLNLPL